MKEFTIKELEDYRAEVQKMAIKPIRFWGKDYYLFIVHKSHGLPKSNLVVSFLFRLIYGKKIKRFMKNSKMTLI